MPERQFNLDRRSARYKGLGVHCHLKMVAEDNENTWRSKTLLKSLMWDADFMNPPCVLVKFKPGFT